MSRSKLTKFCKSCGRQLEDVDQFCDACGTPQSIPREPQLAQRQAGWLPQEISAARSPSQALQDEFAIVSSEALAAMVLALIILVASSLPFSAGTTCPLFSSCSGPTYTALSFASVFPLLWILPVGSVIVLLAPALSLWARSNGRTLRGLTYCLIGALSVLASVAYVAFHGVYTPNLYYPFYVIVAASSVLMVFGVFEWIRWPSALFRAYTPPKRLRVPEVALDEPPAQPQVQSTQAVPGLRASATKEEFESQKNIIMHPRVAIGRPLGVPVLSAYYILSGILGLAAIAILFILLGGYTPFGMALPSFLSYVLLLPVILVLVSFVLAYGLLKGRNWARVTIVFWRF
jgi:hypothetical protein